MSFDSVYVTVIPFDPEEDRGEVLVLPADECDHEDSICAKCYGSWLDDAEVFADGYATALLTGGYY